MFLSDFHVNKLNSMYYSNWFVMSYMLFFTCFTKCSVKCTHRKRVTFKRNVSTLCKKSDIVTKSELVIKTCSVNAATEINRAVYWDTHSIRVITCSCIEVSGSNSKDGYILTKYRSVFFQGHMDEDVQAALLQIIRMRQGFVCWTQHTETTLTPIHHSHSNLPFSSVQFDTVLEYFGQSHILQHLTCPD